MIAVLRTVAKEGWKFMSVRRFGLVTRALDPSRYGKLVKKGFITELKQDLDNGISYIESAYSKRELKVKLGLAYEEDIVEYSEIGNPVDSKKVENTKESESVKSPEVDSISDSKPEGKSMENQYKRLKIDIPKFDLKTGSYEKLVVYTRDLQTFKEICADWSDKEIIFSSLSKSDMTHLRMSMSKDQQEDLDLFIKFLMKNFGISENRKWDELRNIKQRADESPLAFWHRLLNLYFQARGISQPSSITDVSQQKEIQNLFMNGLNDEKLRLHVCTRDFQFNNLAEEVNKVYTALKEIKRVSESLNILSIQSSRGRSPFRTDYRNRSDSRSKSRENYSPERHERRTCFRCGRRGHLRSQCHASAKTVRRYKNFLQQHGSRSQSRSKSRERHVTFEN